MNFSRTIVPVAAAALVAGGIGAGGVLALTDHGSSTRTVTIAAAPAPAAKAPAGVPIEASTDVTPETSTAPLVAPTAAGGVDVAGIYREAGPGVVRIENVQATAADGSTGGGLGSGFVIDRDGYIVTNAHVVDGGGELYVSFSDDTRVKAQLIGSDLATDVALIKVDLPAESLRPIPLGGSDSVQVGDPVVAIGNPFGFDRTVTSGIVSALQRLIEAPNGVTSIPGAIQTDAAINHGNSGGPLLNARGEVIGINSQINTGGTGDGNVGIGFAVPIDLVKSVVAQLRESGVARHAWLGVSLSDIDPAIVAEAKLPVEDGVMVRTIVPNGPAAAAGLRPAERSIVLEGRDYALGGDVIVRIDGRPVTSVVDVREAMLDLAPGQAVDVDVVHADGSSSTVKVTLGDLADAQGAQQEQPQGFAP